MSGREGAVRVLVTGATGFLGRSLVAALRRRGHDVRVLVRPAAKTEGLFDASVEVARADLRGSSLLTPILKGIEVVLHLAAAVRADENEALATTVAGTQRLLDAITEVGTRRLVLASSVAVYDWHLARGALIEETPLTQDFERRRAYTLTKYWQEQIVRRTSGIEFVILRPGFIWGRGREWVDGVGQRLGGFVFIPGPLRQLPLTHVENCAEWFVDAAEVDRAAGLVLNLFDSERISVWRYGREWSARSGVRARLIPVPWVGAVGLVALASLANRMLFSGHAKLPSVLDRPRFEARFKPLRFPNHRLLSVLGPQRFSWADALRQTYAVANI
jgi:nucleoside-diphosphate-sugar epimerase